MGLSKFHCLACHLEQITLGYKLRRAIKLCRARTSLRAYDPFVSGS